MTKLQEIRDKYPEYNFLTDQELSDKLHAKFYPQLEKQDFYSRIGFIQPTTEQQKPSSEEILNASSNYYNPEGKSWSYSMTPDEKARMSEYLKLQSSENRSTLARGAIKGATSLFTVPADLTYMGLNYLTDQNIEPPFGQAVEKALSYVGLDKPKQAQNRIAEDIISGAVSGGATGLRGAVASGAGGGAGSGLAREAGAGPIGQLVGGVAGAFAPSTGAALVNSAKNIISPKDTSVALSNLRPDEELDYVVNVLQKRYGAMGRVEDHLWKIAKTKDPTATLPGDFGLSVIDRIEKKLNTESTSLTHSGMQPLVEKLQKFKDYGSSAVKSNLLDDSGKPIEKIISKDLPVGELIAIRRGISKLISNSSDGVIRNYARQALSELDSATEELMGTGAVGPEVAKSYMDAIKFSRDKFVRYGTGKFQKRAFENIVTNPNVGSADIASVFGTTLKATPANEQFILRAIEQAGPRAQKLKDAFVEYLWQKAVMAAKQERNGRTIIQPNILAKEIDKILDAQATKGGIGQTIRDAVTSPDDLKTLKLIRDNLPKEGVISRIAKESFAILRKKERLQTASEAAGTETLNMIAPVLEAGLKNTKTIRKVKTPTSTKIISGALSGGQSE